MGQIPAKIRQLAATHQLGAPQHVHATQESLLYRFTGLVCLLIGALIIIAYLLLFEHAFIWEPQWQAGIILLVGVAWIGTGGWILLGPFLSPSLRVFVCPAGLIYARQKAAVIPWHKVEAMWKDVHFHASGKAIRTYTVLRADQEKFVFTNTLHEIDKLGTMIEQKVTGQLLPIAVSSYRTVGLVDFDKLVVTLQGISIKERSNGLSWSVIGSISIDEVVIHIYKEHEEKDWGTLRVADIPNVGVFKALVKYILYERQYGQLARCIALYNAGLPVVFGKLSVNMQGIAVNDGKQLLLPWSEITSISVGRSELMIRREDQEWYALPLWMVSDISLLREFFYFIKEHWSILG